MKTTHILKKYKTLFLGSMVFCASFPAHNLTGKGSGPFSNLFCLSKSQPISNRSQGRGPASVDRSLWRLGRVRGFKSEADCRPHQINPMAFGDRRFHLRHQLSREVNQALQALQLEQESNTLYSLNKEGSAAQEFRALASRMNFAPRCLEKFAGNQKFGPLGRYIKEVLSKNSGRELIRRNIDFAGACPGYREMNSEQRKNLWVFIMMSMSHYESSCNESVYNEGPNGIAAGLLQLHEESEDLYASWDPDFNCDKGASRSAHQSLKCGLTMITNQIHKEDSLFFDSSHWQVLRNVKKPGTQAYHIRYALSQIADCRAPQAYPEMGLHEEKTSGEPQARQREPAREELASLRP